MKAVARHLLLMACIFLHWEVGAQITVAERGRVNMQGSIIDTACTIAVDSREQVIDMDIVPLADIIRNGQGNTRNFSIDLVHCDTRRSSQAEWKQFRITFDGNAEGDLFGIMGKASGVGIRISDPRGQVIIPGSPLTFNTFNPGSMRINYTLQIVANNQPLKAGYFYSSVRFVLDYF